MNKSIKSLIMAIALATTIAPAQAHSNESICAQEAADDYAHPLPDFWRDFFGCDPIPYDSWTGYLTGSVNIRSSASTDDDPVRRGVWNEQVIVVGEVEGQEVNGNALWYELDDDTYVHDSVVSRTENVGQQVQQSTSTQQGNCTPGGVFYENGGCQFTDTDFGAAICTYSEAYLHRGGARKVRDGQPGVFVPRPAPGWTAHVHATIAGDPRVSDSASVNVVYAKDLKCVPR